MSFIGKDIFFWQNLHHHAVSYWPIWLSQNEADGHVVSTLEPIELCLALQRDLFVVFDVNKCVKCSILANRNELILMDTPSATASIFSSVRTVRVGSRFGPSTMKLVSRAVVINLRIPGTVGP